MCNTRKLSNYLRHELGEAAGVGQDEQVTKQQLFKTIATIVDVPPDQMLIYLNILSGNEDLTGVFTAEEALKLLGVEIEKNVTFEYPALLIPGTDFFATISRPINLTDGVCIDRLKEDFVNLPWEEFTGRYPDQTKDTRSEALKSPALSKETVDIMDECVAERFTDKSRIGARRSWKTNETKPYATSWMNSQHSIAKAFHALYPDYTSSQLDGPLTEYPPLFNTQ